MTEEINPEKTQGKNIYHLDVVLGFVVMCFSGQMPVFWKNIVQPSSGLNMLYPSSALQKLTTFSCSLRRSGTRDIVAWIS
jgi:hypothetical protein